MPPWGYPDKPGVAKPKTEVFAPANGWSAPWDTVAKTEKQPDYADDEAKKKLFGVELAKNEKPFDAACNVFEDTSACLWIAKHWLTDPIVIASKDAYLKTLEQSEALLDKDEFAAKLLHLAEEKTEGGRYAIEAKERVNLLKLYADVRGFTQKQQIDNSNKTFVNNEMKIVLVKPSSNDDNATVITQAPNTKSEISNGANAMPLKVKLVSGGAS